MGHSRIHPRALFAATLLAACGFVHEANAGYLAPGVGAGAEDAFVSITSTGSGSSQGSPHHREPLTLVDWEHHVAAPCSTGGMTTQTAPTSSLGIGASALLEATQLATTQLVAWLGPSGKLWLPPPFSTGIFRPPRSGLA